MGESDSPWNPSCNGSIRVELSGHRTTSDSGALLLRDALDNSGVIAALEDRLVDQRVSRAVTTPDFVGNIYLKKIGRAAWMGWSGCRRMNALACAVEDSQQVLFTLVSSIQEPQHRG